MSIRLTYVAFLAASLSGCASPPAGSSFEHVEAPRDGGIVQLFVEADQLSANETTKALWACQSGVEAAQEDADERLIKPDKIDSTLPFFIVSFQKEENSPNTIAKMRENAGFPMKLFIESIN